MTGLTLCALLLLAVAALCGPRRVVGLSARGGGTGTAGQGSDRRPAGVGAWGRALAARLGHNRKDSAGSLEFLVTDVASLLRAGSGPADAWWQGAQVRVDGRGVPRTDALWQRLGQAQGPTGELRGNPRRSPRGAANSGRTNPAGSQQAAGIVAGCSVAQQLGAPLAPVLESVARSVVLAEQGRTDRDAALAGPRSTARILGWLPLFGILLASALGADPIGFLFGGPAGLITVATGGALMLIGRRWIKHLINHARRAGETV